MNLTVNEILEALRQVEDSGRGDEGLTAQEIAAALGNQTVTQSVRTLIRRQIEAGVLVTGRGRRPAMDGVLRPVPVYRVKR